MSLMEEIEFLYHEHLEAARQYLYYQGSEFSFNKAKASKVDAERQKYLSHYYFDLLLKKVRGDKKK